MIKTIQLEPSYYISGDIHLADVDELITAGFRTIVSFQLDNESLEQTPFRIIADYATARGVQAVHLPVKRGKVDDAVAFSFQVVLNTYAGPVFGYCKTGMRAAYAWALAKRGDIPTDEIINRLQMHGFQNELFESQLANPTNLASSLDRFI